MIDDCDYIGYGRQAIDPQWPIKQGAVILGIGVWMAPGWTVPRNSR